MDIFDGINQIAIFEPIFQTLIIIFDFVRSIYQRKSNRDKKPLAVGKKS